MSTVDSSSDERNNWPVPWPERLNVRYSSVPDDSATTKEKFDADRKYWKQVISADYFVKFIPYDFARSILIVLVLLLQGCFLIHEELEIK